MPVERIARHVVLLVCAVVLATMQPAPRAAAADPAVVAPIQGLCDALLTVMKAGRQTPFEQRFGMLAPAVDRALNIGVILQVSVGAMWNTLTPDQHGALLEAFRRYTINSYLNNFDSYSGQRFDVDPNPRAAAADQIVQTKIIPASGESHELDYVMRQAGGASWQAVDVLTDAISRVATQRSDFRALVMRGGGDALLASLEKKAADLAAGK